MKVKFPFRKRWIYLCLVLFALATGAWSCEQSQVLNEAADANKQLEIYSTNQPVPQYDRSVERAVLLNIIDARVRKSLMYTYFWAPMAPRPVWSCPTFGFPIPATSQLTNPDQVVRDASGALRDMTVPQMEPSGIYAPPSTEATYSACMLTNGNASPMYWESPVGASAIPLTWVQDEYGGHFVAANPDEAPQLIDYKIVSMQFDPSKTEVSTQNGETMPKGVIELKPGDRGPNNQVPTPEATSTQ
ncbi:hypothetical protein BH09PAT2_BH09PAT2_04680 [soil metagenome]